MPNEREVKLHITNPIVQVSHDVPKQNMSIDLIKNVVASRYRTSPALRETCQAMEAAGVQPWLFGGAIRDLVCDRAPRDLDIVVTGDLAKATAAINAFTALHKRLALSEGSKGDNEPDVAKIDREGPYVRLEVRGEVVELWCAGGQRGLQGVSPEAQTAARVPKTVFLTIEAIVAKPAADGGQVIVHDGGFIECMTTGVLKARPEWLHQIDPQKYAVKALSMLTRVKGLVLSEYVQNFVVQQLITMTVAKFVELSSQRLGDDESLVPRVVQGVANYTGEDINHDLPGLKEQLANLGIVDDLARLDGVGPGL